MTQRQRLAPSWAMPSTQHLPAFTSMPGPIVLPQAVISAAQMANLEQFRAAFNMGHTDEDATSVLGAIYESIAIRLSILWDFNDMWGVGGNSMIVMIDEDGRVREAASAWTTFLYEEDNQVSADELSAATPGNCVPRWQRAKHWDDYNLFWRE
jgi:hypothetical protein